MACNGLLNNLKSFVQKTFSSDDESSSDSDQIGFHFNLGSNFMAHNTNAFNKNGQNKCIFTIVIISNQHIYSTLFHKAQNQCKTFM